MKIYLKKFVSGQVTLMFALVCFALSPQARAVCEEGCDTSTSSTFLGEDALLNNTGFFNTAIGDSALYSNTDGESNTAIGRDALRNNDTGAGNTATGADALKSNTTGNDNTATGNNALFHNETGNNNTAIGSQALVQNTGNDNTATGVSALDHNTTGNYNTATGSQALRLNETGSDNTATGWSALFSNTTGGANTAIGTSALQDNIIGFSNTAIGSGALANNTASQNTAIGGSALETNTTGSFNMAGGRTALRANTTGGDNTAVGDQALSSNTTGSNNIALGRKAGSLITGSNNIDIGHQGAAGDAGIIRIGTAGTHSATFIAGISGAMVSGGVGVLVGTNGKLGTTTSSARFKDNIQPMDKASEVIHALKPVTFRYKHELDPDGIPQFGLVAEHVEKINPDLIVRDEQGKPYTVRYEAVNAMLLNEFLKEHRKVEEQAQINQQQEATIAQLKSTVAQQQKDFQSIAARQQKQIEALTAGLQKVSAQVEMSKPASRMVLNSQ